MKQKKTSAFAETCRAIGVDEKVIKRGAKGLRYNTPVEKGLCWEVVRMICKKRSSDCYTCPAKKLEGINAQAGHYQPVAIVGSNNRKSWDTRFIRLQCSRCNGAGQGMQNVFRKKLVEEMGEKVVAKFDKEVEGKVVDKVVNWKELLDYLVQVLKNTK